MTPIPDFAGGRVYFIPAALRLTPRNGVPSGMFGILSTSSPQTKVRMVDSLVDGELYLLRFSPAAETQRQLKEMGESAGSIWVEGTEIMQEK
jgi:hypothetical protein